MVLVEHESVLPYIRVGSWYVCIPESEFPVNDEAEEVLPPTSITLEKCDAVLLR